LKKQKKKITNNTKNNTKTNKLKLLYGLVKNLGIYNLSLLGFLHAVMYGVDAYDVIWVLFFSAFLLTVIKSDMELS